MTWLDRRGEYEAIARSIDPAARLTTKDHWVWAAMGTLLHGVTFGGITKQKFLHDYATTIGPVQAYPRHWHTLSRRLLTHEARHVRQARWFGLMLHPWVGLPLFAIAYLFLPLPLGLAYLRYRFELDADVASWRWALQNGYTITQVREHAERRVETLAGGNYGWPWPRAFVKRGYRRQQKRTVGWYVKQTKSRVSAKR